MAKRIGEILLDRGVITEDQLQEALRKQPGANMYLCQILIRMGVPMMEIEDALAEQRRQRAMDRKIRETDAPGPQARW
jgi:hypothetical protein